MEQVQRRAKVSALAQRNLTEKMGRNSGGGRCNSGEWLKEQVEEMRVSCEKAQKANRAKTEFISTLTHELRMPIHVIVGCGDLLLDGAWGMLQENQKAIVVKMRQNASYLFDLISDLMELNRLDGGRGVTRCEEIDINGLLEEMKMVARLMPKTEGVVLEVMTPAGLPLLISDRDRLKIILRNLVGNAIKFTKEGRITISAHFDPEDQMMELTVRDTGIGIDEKERQHIFEMFWQGDDSHARPFGGVGLGLYIVKRLGDQIGAEIEVESEKGKGSLFQLRIPLQPY
ncbi:MAG: HAMP domain-containing histidine kinase [Deltaproteobacteria bacterium]|nr:HAMP domain-containing histidine kinase [Deltaproteobacteria bacterium]